MNCIIPFESRVHFNNPIKEICSISLEHEITKNDTEVLGNFLISGTYKEHELSVNTSDFKFTIPFNVELTTRIEGETLEFSIDNFTYDLENNDMIIKIDYIVSADDVREEIIEEENDPLELIEPVEEVPVVIPVLEKEEERDDQEEMISAIETENDYITYHIHIVKEEETIDSISLNYKTTKDELEKLNDVNNIMAGDKLIIPLLDE